MTLLTGLLGVLIGGAIAEISGHLRENRGRRHERQKWQRDERLAAYVAFVAAIEQMFGAIFELELLGVEPDPEHFAALPRHDLDAAEARVILMGNDAAVELSRAIVRTLARLASVHFFESERSIEDLEEELRRQREAFIRAARQEFA